MFHPHGSRNISRFYDTSINKINLEDCDTIQKLFGGEYSLLPDIDDFPRIEIVNARNNQMLTMFMHNGNAKCYFSVYQVEYLNQGYYFAQKPFRLNAKEFISSRKMKLGLSMKDLKLLFGEPAEIRMESGKQVISYQAYDGFYFADYYFSDNRLVKFRFGFEYP